MEQYAELSTDLLIALYQEISKNINNGLLSKNMYYELGLMVSVASQRGITLEQPTDFEQIVGQKSLNDYIHSKGRAS